MKNNNEITETQLKRGFSFIEELSSMKVRQQSVWYENKFQNAIDEKVTEGTCESQYDNISVSIDFLQRTIDKALKDVNLDGLSKAVFLMGPSGAGKSTTANYVAGKKLVVEVTEEDEAYLKLLDGEPIFHVGDGSGSTTVFPNMSDKLEPFPGQSFIDFAGDFDDSGVIVEILNSKSRAIIANACKEFKLVCVTPHTSFQAGGSYGRNVGDFLLSVAKAFGDPTLEGIKDSTTIIVSHAELRRGGKDGIIKSISKLSSTSGHVKTFQNFIDHVVDSNNVGLFCKVADEIDVGQEYLPPSKLPNQREEIIENINKTSWKKMSEVKFDIPCGPVLREAIPKAIDIVNASIATSLVNELRSQCIGKSKKIKSDNLQEKQDRIKKLMEHEKKDLEEYISDDLLFNKTLIDLDHNAQEELKIDSSTDQKHKSHIRERSFKKYASDLSYLNDILSGESKYDWATKIKADELLGGVSKEITDLMEGSEQIIGNKFQDGRYVGYNIKFSEINITLKDANIPGNCLRVFALNELILDEDLKKLPGYNVVMLAPKWSIKDKVEINLSGKDQDNYPDSLFKAKNGENAGESGADGKPGLAGFSGGNFYGKGKTFDSIEKLSIISNGGKGGPGQAGGNGADGGPVESSNQGFLYQGFFGDAKISFVGNKPTQSSGGDAGTNGAGGKGGKKGSIIIDGAKEFEQQAEEGEKGSICTLDNNRDLMPVSGKAGEFSEAKISVTLASSDYRDGLDVDNYSYKKVNYLNRGKIDLKNENLNDQDQEDPIPVPDIDVGDVLVEYNNFINEVDSKVCFGLSSPFSDEI